MTDDPFFGDPEPGAVSDPAEASALAEVKALFSANRDRIFFSRQLEVRYERTWFHWVTNRAVRALIESGAIESEVRQLATASTTTLLWSRSYRYPRREAARVVALIEEYAHPDIGMAIGRQGELLVLEGLADAQFRLLGRETRAFEGEVWAASEHDLDFIVERDGRVYGVEVKNTLGYLDLKELRVKIRMCEFLGIVPVFVVRMMPKTWINDVVQAGGFVLVFGYQLYPLDRRDLAARVRETFGLPVDAPRSLARGTIQRFVTWHTKQL